MMAEKTPYYDVKIDASLREPVRRFAFDNNLKIGKFVSEAVREKMEKEKNNQKRGENE